jgi:hypothetical protein
MLALVASSGAYSTEGYLCAVDQAVGFSYQSGHWSQVVFHNEDKYVIARSSEARAVWEVKQLGERWALVRCAQDFNEADNLFCEGVAELRMSRKSLRFLYIYPNGYWTALPGEVEGENTPYMGMGKCSPL